MAKVRIVKYLPKHTSASTQYREIDPEDMAWITQQMIQWLAHMAELDQKRDEDTRWVLANWWHKRTDKLNKGQLGQNTPCSTVGGILNNIMFKEPLQRDLTHKQMSDLEYISAIIGQVFPGCEPLRFQMGLA